MRKANLSARCAKMNVELGYLGRWKDLAGGQERNRLHRETSNGAWLSDVTHHLNGTKISQEEFRDNLRLRFGLIPQDIPTTCDDCGKTFLIENTLSCPKGGLVLAWQDDSAKEWEALGSQALVPSAITYKPKINSRTVQGERTRAGAPQEGGEADGGTETVGESQGGRGRTIFGAARLVGQPG